jgi:N-acetylmuramoyl-L-alanine amidase
MIQKFPLFARLTGIALAGFALLAAGELPSPTPLNTPISSPALNVPALTATPALAVETAAIAESDDTTASDITPERPATLSRLVSAIVALPATPVDAEDKCLTKAVFFEARGEPLEGQLAVAQVILNRVASGHYSGSVCGVINQPGQFSFHSRAVSENSNDWRIAQAVAIIAQAQSWSQVAPRTTAFHAASVRPGWGNMERVSRIGNHVFYR